MKYIIANWKMNMDYAQTQKWLDDFGQLISGKNFKNKIILAPPAIYLEKTFSFCKYTSIESSAQDVSLYDKGAHTGEVGAFEIKDFCKFSIVGHSERKEPRDLVIQKSNKCIENNITPFLCFVDKTDFEKEADGNKIMCWEDPSNISKNGVYQKTGIEDIKDMMKSLKQINQGVVTLYGGSVNRDNMQDLVDIDEIGGVLVGNASLDPLHFFDIINTFEKK